jgi:hypothetical protein
MPSVDGRNGMPDKQPERFYINKLRDVLLGLPSDHFIDGESPDFRIGDLGIEVTEFYYPPRPGERPHQELQALKERVVGIAERLHSEAGGPPLYLTAIFNEQRPLTKRSVPQVARALASAVLSQEAPRSVRDSVKLCRAVLPNEIPHVHVRGSVDGHDKLWQASAGGFVQQVESHHVQSVIDAKMQKAALARSCCARLWLLIVHDISNGAEAAEITAEALTATYGHSFDRVLWFEPHVPRATDLRVPAAV